MKTLAAAIVVVAAVAGFGSAGQAVTVIPGPVGVQPGFAAPDGLVQMAQASPALMSEGAGYFRESCTGCHGAQGEGNVGPALAGNTFLESVAAIGEIVLVGTDPGHAYMPPFAETYNDAQLVALITYVRNSWGNAFGAVPVDQIAIARAAAGGGGGGGML